MADDAAVTVSRWTGLYRSSDPFALPPGAMSLADNVVVPGPSLLQPRRGFRALVATYVDYSAIGAFYDVLVGIESPLTLSGIPNKLHSIDPDGTATGLNRGASDLTLAPALLSGYNGGPTYQAKTRMFTANGNFYTSANFGLARLTDSLGTWVPSGLYQPNLTNVWGTVAGTLLPALGSTVGQTTYTYGSQVSYRATIRFEDANGVIHRSAPSAKQVVRNISGSVVDPVSYFYCSPMVPPTSIIEVWRTFTIDVPSNGGDTTGEEFFKVAELALATTVTTSSSSGYAVPGVMGNGADYAVAFTDKTPNTPFLVEPLYTNPTTGDINGLGIANANVPPPAAADVFVFKGRTYFCNTEEVESLTVQITGTGTGGIVLNDTFTVNGFTYTWLDNTTTPGTQPLGYGGVILWYTGGAHDAGSVAENLRQSAMAAAFAINATQGAMQQSVQGLSGPTVEIPVSAQLLAQQQTINQLGGYLTIQNLVPGRPAITVLPGTGSGRGWAGALAVNNVSDSNRQPANLMQSQANDPESVPPGLTNSVGQLELPILRGVALRDNAYIFKGGGDGLWKFADDGSGTLDIGPLDQTINLIAPETAVALDNAIYCLTDKGAVRITDGGAPDNISNNKIQDDLEQLYRSVGPVTMARLAFGVAYESERTYVLCLPESANSINCTIQYVYNIQTDAWTRWTLPALACGIVHPDADDVLVFGQCLFGHFDGAAGSIWVERKTLTDADYEDPTLLTAVPGAGTYAASALVFTGDNRPEWAEGDLAQYERAGHSYLLRVTDVTYASGPDETTVTLEESITWHAGDDLYIRKGIQAALRLLPLSAEDPLFEKQWQNVYLFFREVTANTFDITYSTDKQLVPQLHELPGPTETAWLYSETLGFGLAPWGMNAKDQILKMPLDQKTARCSALTVGIACSDALSGWQLSALRIPYDPSTIRPVK